MTGYRPTVRLADVRRRRKTTKGCGSPGALGLVTMRTITSKLSFGSAARSVCKAARLVASSSDAWWPKSVGLQPVRQAALIRQFQEQHYQQYMSQVYAQQAAATTPRGEKAPDDEKAREDDSDVSDEEPGDDLPSNPAIAPASLWNRKDIAEFKVNIKKEGSEGVIKVGHGETVTVRVPTHEDGTCLYWEFATDYYDIGFGVYFEWTIAESNQVSIHVSESDEEEDYEEGVEGEEGPPPAGGAPGDVESGGAPRRERNPNKPRQDEIIPVYRRDCHEEVYAGSHQYPGRGVYLLKFDNSYSLWRSKTLYYRVYYSK
ncbi:unnamed protein product [Caenorhabditis auriculariae]|uniref:GOLD domain-containing protein n=1 Tax=Caenorhabditis auriculariae TaxID=2777116 RepID=A0A8S1HBN2_9PELO|nr:unnamed protein product [Caenorhabditis auriculariae]